MYNSINGNYFKMASIKLPNPPAPKWTLLIGTFTMDFYRQFHNDFIAIYTDEKIINFDPIELIGL